MTGNLLSLSLCLSPISIASLPLPLPNPSPVNTVSPIDHTIDTDSSFHWKIVKRRARVKVLFRPGRLKGTKPFSVNERESPLLKTYWSKSTMSS